MDTFFSDICRTCMIQFSKTDKKVDKNKQSIHEVPKGFKNNSSIMELLETVQPQIKLEIRDCFPILICPDCVKKLLVSYEFVEMYKKANTKLHNMLKEVDTTNMCYDKLDESLELNKEESLKNEANLFEVTKYKIEIEQINIEGHENEAEIENECPLFGDATYQEFSEEYINKETPFKNPNIGSSDKEWTPDQICQKRSTSSISKKIHKKIITKKKNEKNNFFPIENSDGNMPCQQCEAVFQNIKLWQEHMLQHRLEKRPKTKANQSRKRQSNESLFECEHCDKVFPKMSLYRSHMRVHTDEEPYLCIECGKSFKAVSSLNAHMLRHKGEKNFQCPHCPKKFVTSSGLYGHMMVHRKDKPYVCDACGSAFHMAHQLRKHNLYHNGIKNYQCEYCDMRFVTREKQHRHMRTHTGEKPYRCKYCDRAFAQSNDCVKHLRQHLGENVYQCELCPLRFPLARDLRTHFATHKDDDDETRVRNLEARVEGERNLQIKLSSKEPGANDANQIRFSIFKCT